MAETVIKEHSPGFRPIHSIALLSIGALVGIIGCSGSSGSGTTEGEGDSGLQDSSVPHKDSGKETGSDAPPLPPAKDANNDTDEPATKTECELYPWLCEPPVCGDGVLGLGETCDDGNTDDDDGCSSTCHQEAAWFYCRDGQLCIDRHDCDAVKAAGLDESLCIFPPPLCGDGFVDIDVDESCDDGNTEDGDGCSSLCSLEDEYICPEPGAPCISTTVCGDGRISGEEQCDDGNALDGDGCSSSCQLEPGWMCPVVKVPCVARKCGDGILAGDEQCDDGNTTSGDGCDSNCRLQANVNTSAGNTTTTHFHCPTPGAPCEPTNCGNGYREGSEQCDDANLKPFDGCSEQCMIEPKCPNGTCQAVCGDGLLFDFDGEECDDGNTIDGDGCSHDCMIEPGYNCSAYVEDTPAFIDIPVVFRDFKHRNTSDPEAHPDFNVFSCASVSPNLVKNALVDGTPVFNQVAGFSGCGNQLTSALDFTDWYKDVPVNGVQRGKRIDGKSLRLQKQVDGSYQYSNSAFLLIDGLGWGNQTDGRNYSFTTELRYWFTYDAGASPTLLFSGDDDVWVFVNGKMALDLGGLHSELSGSFTLNAAKAAELGLVNGRLYEMTLFHAERHPTGSNFRLTLRSFVKKRSVCVEVCGDGIRTRSEQCDDGYWNTDSGTYGSCTTSCTLGPHCGDKVMQSPKEDCDDGVNLSTWAFSLEAGTCGPGCTTPAYCGDGVVQAGREHCDLGTANNTGSYGGCKADCTRSARCGDGTVQSEHEECDNGYNIDAYVKHPTSANCAHGCKVPKHCGDGILDSLFEYCDKGTANTNNGSYNSCTTECTLGPRCGDGILQAEYEECDDGNTDDNDLCSSDCKYKGGIQ